MFRIKTRNNNLNQGSGRSKSILELLRISFLLLLIACHYFDKAKFLDVRILQSISDVSVSGFALITGMFVFNERRLVFRNISRLIFIIIFSIIISGFMSISGDFSISKNIFNIFTGSAYIWYIYAIIPIYVLGPLMYKWMKKTKTSIVLLMGIALFMIGIFGWWFNILYSEEKLNIEFFYMHEVGLLFSIPFLLSLAFFGFLLNGWMKKNSRVRVFKILFFVFFVSVSAIVTLTVFLDEPMIGHGNPLITLLAISLVGMASNVKWYSSKVNWVSKRLYFVYEYHWFWIFLFKLIFSNFIVEFPHLQFYVAWIVIALFASFVSVIITEIQIRVWNRYIDPRLLKITSWVKSKLTQPKVIN